ncbi:MAG TPA: HD domain-containing protein [Spirochaetia bacterium]|nr:HD domain-containing protein [Spirochaetia bacterium]
MTIPSHEVLESIWRRYNTDESLYRHALSVESAMRHFAEKHGEDIDFWSAVGFLHDIDYGTYPHEHLKHTREILSENGFDEQFIHAVLSHGWKLCSDIEPEHIMEKVLYAVDELTGFIAACAYVRPSKSVMDLEVSSVKKKWKTPAFAAGVNRTVIEEGAQMLGMTLEDLIGETIIAMRKDAKKLGL